MNELYEKSLHKLELDKVLALLADQACSPSGKEQRQRHCDVRAYTQTVSGYGRRDHDLKPGQSVLSETGRTQAKLHDHDHR